MHRSIDTIVDQCSKFGYVSLTQEETERYLPHLDSEIKKHRLRAHKSAFFVIEQNGFMIRAKVSYFENTYRASVYEAKRALLTRDVINNENRNKK